jgi:hypothetical protein
MKNYFYERTNKHINYVRQILKYFKDNEMTKRGENHDKSKF